MGLLEKAFQFKKNINEKGKATLIDKIQGPAETDFDENEDVSAAPLDEQIEHIRVNLDDEVKVEDNMTTGSKTLADDFRQPPDYDLFELPEDDGIAAREELNSQKIGTQSVIGPATSPKIIKSAAVVEEDFFTPEDEPVLFNPEQHRMESTQAEVRSSQGRSDIKAADPEQGAKFLGDISGFENDSDVMVMYEIEKDIINSDSRQSLFEVMLFAVMGQLGVSSASIIVPSDDGAWHIADYSGIEIDKSEISFNPHEGILKILLSGKESADIEKFNTPEFRDDYYKYLSIDARMLIPVSHSNAILAAMALGNKITGEDYNDNDFKFLDSVAGISARMLHILNMSDDLKKEIDKSNLASGQIREIDSLQNQILSSINTEGIYSLIRAFMASSGVESYAYFNKFENDATFRPVITEKEDFLLLRELDFNIKINNNFLRYISGYSGLVDINDFKRSEIVRGIFTESQINKMTHLRIYPFSIAGRVAGFISLFRISNNADLPALDMKMSRIARFIFSYINSMQDINFKESRYTDNIEIIFKRIDDEIINARSLGIPLTLILFSIKNYKRFFNLYGYEEVKKLFDNFEKIIKGRLSDGDFSVRYDRHKVLLILPGKDKKYAVPLANAVRNELISSFQKNEIQLLLTYLTAEYPEDGTNLHSLIDTID